MPDTNQQPLVKGRQWKLWLLIILVVGLLFDEWIAQWLQVPSIYYVRIPLCLIAFFMLVVFLDIRCPRCKLGLMGYAISQKSIGKWLDWLLAVKECPKCGFRRDSAHSE